MKTTAFVNGAALPSKTRRAHASICMQAGPGGEREAEKGTGSTAQKLVPQTKLKSQASWANIFLPDFGKRGPGSRPDWDLRPKSLRPIEEGAGICDSCNGTGVMTCSFCNGTTFMKADGTIEPCPACGGEVEITCSACFGTGKQIEVEGNWWTKGLDALFNE